ncbi:leukocyte surface antigen CD47 isoform X3 [Pogona vitticeps]
MWALRVCWVLLGTLAAGSAQLLFEKIQSVTMDPCNSSTAIIPCRVTNLKLNNTKVMFVKWKIQGKEFFTYDGVEDKYARNTTFQSANLLNLTQLPYGIASIVLSRKEAISGNYTCEVAESNREGDTVVELIYKSASWFSSPESSFIIATVIVAVFLYWFQLAAVAVKFDMTLQKKSELILMGVIVSAFAVIGVILFVPAGYESSNQAGLGLIVVPAVVLVPLLYFLFTSVFEKQPLFAILLLVVKAIGYLIAVIGFFLSVSACPPRQGSVVIAGLAIIDIVAVIGLIYLLVIGGSSLKDHQPPRKAVEESLNAGDVK